MDMDQQPEAVKRTAVLPSSGQAAAGTNSIDRSWWILLICTLSLASACLVLLERESQRWLPEKMASAHMWMSMLV